MFEYIDLSFIGELTCYTFMLYRKIESARLMDNTLPEKIWFKVCF